MNDLSKILARLDRAGGTYLSRLAFAGALAAVAVMSLLPEKALPPMPDVSDKVEHAVAYAVLAGLAALSWRQGRELLLAFAALILMGAAIEILQRWIPGRSGEWLDFAADVAGVLIGAAASTLYSERRLPG